LPANSSVYYFLIAPAPVVEAISKSSTRIEVTWSVSAY